MSRLSACSIALPLLSLAGCVAPRTVAVKAPAVPPTIAPPPPARSADWRDWPRDPGTWRYAARTASFGVAGVAPALVVRCEPSAVVTVTRAGPPAATPRTMQFTTSEGVRTYPAAATVAGATVAFAARDAWLDALAFSRGRIVVALTGLPPLVIPAWAEIGRVVEDCRG